MNIRKLILVLCRVLHCQSDPDIKVLVCTKGGVKTIGVVTEVLSADGYIAIEIEPTETT